MFRLKAIVFGQVGLRKKRFLGELEDLVQDRGKTLRVYNVGDMMYQCDPSIRQGRILEKCIPDLKNLRAAVFNNILANIHNDDSCDNFLINSHATFRWSNGLFRAFSNEEIQKLQPDLCITIIDNIQNIKLSLSLRNQKPDSFTLKDIIVWREEEMLAAEMAASLCSSCREYVAAKEQGPELLYKLIFHSDAPKVYISYPITLVLGHEDILKEINDFRKRLKDTMTCFDPFAISESALITEYNLAKSQKNKRTHINLTVHHFYLMKFNLY